MTGPYAWHDTQVLIDAKTPSELEQLQLRRDQLNAMLTARRGKPGFAANVIAVEAELASIDAQISGSDGASLNQTS